MTASSETVLLFPTASRAPQFPIARGVREAIEQAGLPIECVSKAAPGQPVDCILCLNGADLRAAHAHPKEPTHTTLIVALIGDLAMPRDWAGCPPPHAALLAHPALRPSALALGVADAAIVSTGVPLPSDFRADREQARQALGISSSARAVFLAARGLAGETLQRLMLPLALLGPGMELLCDADTHDAAVIGPAAKLHDLRARVVTDKSKLGDAMAAADVLIGAPPPAQLFSALWHGLRVFLPEPEGATQQKRASVLRRSGAGGELTAFSALSSAIGELTSTSEPPPTHPEHELTRVTRGAGERVALALEGLLHNRETLVAFTSSHPKAEVQAPPAPHSAPGLLEIGAHPKDIQAARRRKTAEALTALEVDRALRELKDKIDREREN